MYDSGINMEEDVLEKLRTVFNVCDERNEGYITVEHFKDLAKEHFGQFGDDEVRRFACVVGFFHCQVFLNASKI